MLVEEVKIVICFCGENVQGASVIFSYAVDQYGREVGTFFEAGLIKQVHLSKLALYKCVASETDLHEHCEIDDGFCQWLVLAGHHFQILHALLALSKRSK